MKAPKCKVCGEKMPRKPPHLMIGRARVCDRCFDLYVARGQLHTGGAK